MYLQILQSEMMNIKKYFEPDAKLMYCESLDIINISGDVPTQDENDPFDYAPKEWIQ